MNIDPLQQQPPVSTRAELVAMVDSVTEQLAQLPEVLSAYAGWLRQAGVHDEVCHMVERAHTYQTEAANHLATAAEAAHHHYDRALPDFNKAH